MKTSYAIWLHCLSAEKWYLRNEPSRQAAKIVPCAEDAAGDDESPLLKAQMQATSCGTVNEVRDHCEPA